MLGSEEVDDLLLHLGSRFLAKVFTLGDHLAHKQIKVGLSVKWSAIRWHRKLGVALLDQR